MTERKVLVCGAGLMGHGIAQVMAAAGHRVWLYEPDAARAEAGRERIAGNLERAVAKGKISDGDRTAQLGRVSVATSLDEAASQAELVVEAIFEDEAVKQALFAEVAAAAQPSTVLASNTSSISITRLAATTSAGRRARFVGMHFFSPVPVMPLIELIRGAETDDATEAYVRDVAAELGKQVIVSKDRPGFIVNRILMPYLGESMRAFEEGLGTAEDIDSGAKVGLNHPMGPLELADFIGLDVCLHIMEVLQEGFGAAHMAPPPILRQLVDAGHLGQKTGRGFYAYPREPKKG
ncbi:MAG TPA: 3-hydroxyacyl-CoA dehydrogenase NAD-binding domain-containing protein [Candidatus Limnocylindrales bacterium]|nr:3-hydroxyacyl-CoA dehydrogenase NAD-binding domain-containing protein [Candidatus Limnocylindrales bacterium]